MIIMMLRHTNVMDQFIEQHDLNIETLFMENQLL